MKKLFGLLAPNSYWNATSSEITAASNACGPQGFDHLVPNSIVGVDVSEACHIHDWMYSKKMNEDERKVADDTFYENLVYLVETYASNVVSKTIGKFVAWIYYQAVRKFGSNAMTQKSEASLTA